MSLAPAAASTRQTSPKRTRRETRSTSTLEDSTGLLDGGSDDDVDILDQSPVANRAKRRRTELKTTGDDHLRKQREREPQLEERARVEVSMAVVVARLY